MCFNDGPQLKGLQVKIKVESLVEEIKGLKDALRLPEEKREKDVVDLKIQMYAQM